MSRPCLAENPVGCGGSSNLLELDPDPPELIRGPGVIVAVGLGVGVLVGVAVALGFLGRGVFVAVGFGFGVLVAVCVGVGGVGFQQPLPLPNQQAR